MEGTEQINDTIYNTLASYGNWGLALVIILATLFIAQMIFHLAIYGKIASFRLTARKKIREEGAPISIVVVLPSEDSDYIDNGLMQLLGQNYPDFEVVVVYTGDSNDFFAELNHITRISPRLKPIFLRADERHQIKKKVAMNVAIKSATYDHIIMTNTDATPVSEKWLSLMAKGFVYGDVVLGYSGVAYKPGFDNFIFREYRISNSMAWLSAAIRRKTYSASNSAFGFVKDLYLGVRGFNHLDMDVGDDDLFLQQIATRNNVSVVLAPSATCRERSWGSWRWWINQVSRQRLTHRFYPRMTLAPVFLEQASRLLLFAFSIAAFATMPWEFCLGVVLLLVARFLATLFSARRVWRRLGEEGLTSRHIIYDLAEPFIRLYIILSSQKISKTAWRV